TIHAAPPNSVRAEFPTPAQRDIRAARRYVGSFAMTRQSSTDGPEPDVTAARASDAQLRKIIDTIPVLAFCTRADGANEFTNQRGQDYTGLSQQDTSGWRWQAAIHPDDLPAVLERWRSLIRSGDAGEAEGRLRRSDGVFRWFLIRVEPLRD